MPSKTRPRVDVPRSGAGVTALLGALLPVCVAGLHVAAGGTLSIRSVVVTAVGVAVAAGMAWFAGRLIVQDLLTLSSNMARAGVDSPLEVSRRPDSAGVLVGRVVTFRNRLRAALGRVRRARADAEQAERYEAEFLKTMSHELRTPLNAVLGFTQVLLDEIDGPLSEGQREDLGTIRSSGDHLRALVDDVLDLAAMQSGRFQLKRGPVRVGQVVFEVARLLEGQRADRPVQIVTEVSEDLPEIQADDKRLRQLVMNLATNALKFTTQGSVTLGARAASGGVELAVSDTGPGISAGELRVIFEEFIQVGDVSRRSQGSGLGLAICKRLTELHEGRIEVQSIVGRGSVFSVWLPGEPEA